MLKNRVRFQNVPLSSDNIHTYPSILRYDKEKKQSVLQTSPSTWIDNEDGFASEALATNETHALIAIFDQVEVADPEPATV